eukprot:442642-Ditylum_brightwellii.AAC.1
MLDADGTMKKGCKLNLWTPMAGYKKVSSRYTKCKTISRSQIYPYSHQTDLNYLTKSALPGCIGHSNSTC